MKTYKKAIVVYNEKISECDCKIVDVEIMNNCAGKILTMVVDGMHYEFIFDKEIQEALS